MKTEKQELIINSATKEFVKSGFEKASTNEIVKEANISKGSLFNYFNSKKELYFYLIEYGVQVVEQIYEQIDLNETDLFKRIEKLGLKKLHIQRKFPQVFDFLTSLAHEESDEVKDDIQHKINYIFERGIEKLYQNIDYSKFREGINVQKAIDILNWTMLGFAERAVNQLDTFEEVGEQYIKEWESYSKVLRDSFYK
ncbi:TetR/AcrR family transcriptional regulator [Oceanobacillus sp. GSFE11]|uniref:TetR/AcrR family transcriptional regulator n=1 Tax=Oceanobacillus jordanicus TaxID=2867266 RepID=A0AAW5B143_9BACI|nr:TetR/AcrR family transcriptional regulator [Oceanobacillus jordanicus]MCG3418191.1 TetR/AcrR family transcriptional regulator [Oceanobacillus jordanicus]